MKTKIFLSLLAGFALGAVATWFVVRQKTLNVFAIQYLSGVMDQANVALHIRAGKQTELLANIQAALPGYVLVVQDAFRGYAGSTNALWMIKAYYERNEIVIPQEIKGILNTLPPKPPTACQIRLRALDEASTTNTTDTRGPK